MTGSSVSLSQAEKLYCFRNQELDNVVIEQLNAVVETLTTIKASSDSEKPVEKIEEPATASNVVKNFEPAPEPNTMVPEPITMVPEPVKEPVVEPKVKELVPVEETEWVQVTTKKAKKNKKKSKSKSESKSPTPKVDEPETKTVEAVEVSEPISVVVEPVHQALEQPAPATVDETTAETTDEVETVDKQPVPTVDEATPALTKTDVVETSLDAAARTADALCAKMEGMSVSGAQAGEVGKRLGSVEEENKALRSLLTCLEARLTKLEGGKPAAAAPAPAKAAPAPAAEDDDDFDMFGDDDEVDEEAEKRNAQRIADYNAKKAAKGKPAVIAKSSVLLDCKPWDDETDMAAFEAAVRTIVMEGLVWGASKLVPVAYGLKKLQIGCVIEDDKVSTEVLEEKICEFEDYCQSVDIAAFNKI